MAQSPRNRDDLTAAGNAPGDIDLGESIELPVRRKSTGGRKPPIREDVHWDNVDHLLDEDEDEVPLTPVAPEVEANLAARAATLEFRPPLEAMEEPPRYQFSLRDVLLANTVLAILFALVRALAPSWVAGFLGIATLVAAILMAIYQPENKRVEMAWWVMLLVYVSACAFAIYR